MLSAAASSSIQRTDNRLPALMLWAWERTEDFRFLKPGDAGVAFLARTIEIDRGELKIRSRRNPLHVPPQTPLVVVVRLEVRRTRSLEKMTEPVAASIVDLWKLAGVLGLQVDFDATRSQRNFYRAILNRLKATKPSNRSLTITALGSWCLGDPWIRDLPVDEAVPMLFQMGLDAKAVKEILARQGDFMVPLARFSVGYSLDEPLIPIPSGRRIYVFSPRPWTGSDFQTLKARLGR